MHVTYGTVHIQGYLITVGYQWQHVHWAKSFLDFNNLAVNHIPGDQKMWQWMSLAQIMIFLLIIFIGRYITTSGKIAKIKEAQYIYIFQLKKEREISEPGFPQWRTFHWSYLWVLFVAMHWMRFFQVSAARNIADGKE